MRLWLLALKNLWRNPRRTIVTGLAMSIGFAGLSLFNGYVRRIEISLALGSVYVNHMGHLMIMKKNWIEKGLTRPALYSLNQEDQARIKTFLTPYEDAIAYQAPLFIGTGLISNGCRSVPFFLKGLTPDFKKWVFTNDGFLKWAQNSKPKYFRGKDFTFFEESESALMLTENLARLLNKQNLYTNQESMTPAKIIDCTSMLDKASASKDPSVQLMAKTLDGGLSAIDANVVGHFSLGFIFLEDMGVQTSLALAQRLFDTQSISRWITFLKDPSTLKKWKLKIKPQFEKLFPDFEMLFYDEERINPFYTGTVSFLNSLSFFFVIIAGFAVSLAILNSLTINIIERSQEIGTLRALGFKQSQLAWLLGREMLLLSLLSLVAGLMITEIVAALINQVNLTFEPPGASGPVKLEVALDGQFQFVVFLALTVLVGVGSFFLAKRKLRSNIVELLVQS